MAALRDQAHAFSLDVIKEGTVVGAVPLASAVHYLGRQADAVQTALEHPSVSRQHCAIVHRAGGELFLVDLGSTHGTVLNRKPIRPRAFAPLPIGSVFKLGQSSRLFCLCGPAELLPPEHEPIRAQMPAPGPRGAALPAAAAPRAQGTEAATWGQGEEEDAGGDAVEEDDTGLDLDALLARADAAGLRRNERQLLLLDKREKRRSRISTAESEAGRIQGKDDDEDGNGDGLTAGQRTQLDKCLERAEEH
ncbi:SMAD/FHA domain-containing protein, partial [Pavlovales sp. CCMP2436]